MSVQEDLTRWIQTCSKRSENRSFKLFSPVSIRRRVACFSLFCIFFILLVEGTVIDFEEAFKNAIGECSICFDVRLETTHARTDNDHYAGPNDKCVGPGRCTHLNGRDHGARTSLQPPREFRLHESHAFWNFAFWTSTQHMYIGSFASNGSHQWNSQMIGRTSFHDRNGSNATKLHSGNCCPLLHMTD